MKQMSFILSFSIMWLLFLPICTSVYAGQVSLQTKASVTANNEALNISLEIKNSGSESISHLTPVLLFPDDKDINFQNIYMHKSDLLEPGSSIVFNKKVTNKYFKVPGTYTLPFYLAFRDMNGIPFRVVQYADFVIRKRTVSYKLMIISGNILAPKERDTVVTIKNLDSREINLRFKLAMVENIRLTIPFFRLNLQPGQMVEIPVRIELGSKKYLPESRYSNLLVIDYELGNQHYTDKAYVYVDVNYSSTDEGFLSRRKILVICLFFSILLSSFLIFRNMRKSKR